MSDAEESESESEVSESGSSLGSGSASGSRSSYSDSDSGSDSDSDSGSESESSESSESSQSTPEDDEPEDDYFPGERRLRGDPVPGGEPLFHFGQPFTFGQQCQFCEARQAVVLCLPCADFLCAGCEMDVHASERRRLHERVPIPDVHEHEAARRVAALFQVNAARAAMRARLRRCYTRHWDWNHHRMFYRHTERQTSSWYKPRLLGSEELVPPPPLEEAVSRMQRMFRGVRARERLRRMVVEQVVKLYDPASGRYYYFNNASGSSSWTAPAILLGQDIPPYLSEHVAAIRIQGLVRCRQARAELRRRIRVVFHQGYDARYHRYYYWDTRTGERRWDRPLLLGAARWDPFNVYEWDTNDLCDWLERHHAAPLVRIVKRCKIRGAQLASLKLADYAVDLELANDSVLAKRVYHGLKAVKQQHRRRLREDMADEADEVEDKRRTRRNFKKQMRLERAVVMVQANYRGRLARETRKLMLRALKEHREEVQRRRVVERGQMWWTEHVPKTTPSLHGVVPKPFGKRKHFLGVGGWGHWVGDKWETVEAPDPLKCGY